MEPTELHQTDYVQTATYFHELASVRFKLLAFVPVLTGAGLTLADKLQTPSLVFALGLFGFLSILGIVIYDQRNSQIYNAMQCRAKSLEALMDFPPLNKKKVLTEKMKRGGAFLDRPRRTLKLFGILTIWHDLGLAIIYSANLAVWSYLTGISFVKVVFPSHLGLGSLLVIASSTALAIVILFSLLRLDEATDIEGALLHEIRTLIWPS
jgi:hypothetical protein